MTQHGRFLPVKGRPTRGPRRLESSSATEGERLATQKNAPAVATQTINGLTLDLAIPEGSSPAQTAHYTGKFLADSPAAANSKIVVSQNAVTMVPGAGGGQFFSPLSSLPPAPQVWVSPRPEHRRESDR